MAAQIFTYRDETYTLEQVEAMMVDPSKNFWVSYIPNLPEHVLDQLVGSDSAAVREDAALRDDLLPRHADALSRDPSPVVRKQVAWSLACSEEVLLRLIRDSSKSVRCAVAMLFTATAPVVAVAVRDPSWEVRRNIAKHGSLTEQQIEVLLLDPEYRVRLEVCLSSRLSPEQLVRVERDGSKQVRDAARKAKLPAGWEPWVNSGWSFSAIAAVAEAGMIDIEVPYPSTLAAFPILAAIERKPRDAVAR